MHDSNQIHKSEKFDDLRILKDFNLSKHILKFNNDTALFVYKSHDHKNHLGVFFLELLMISSRFRFESFEAFEKLYTLKSHSNLSALSKLLFLKIVGEICLTP